MSVCFPRPVAAGFLFLRQAWRAAPGPALSTGKRERAGAGGPASLRPRPGGRGGSSSPGSPLEGWGDGLVTLEACWGAGDSTDCSGKHEGGLLADINAI